VNKRGDHQRENFLPEIGESSEGKERKENSQSSDSTKEPKYI
jgi:hypothetical protein